MSESIYDLAPTASAAVRAMCEGLKKQSERDDFRVYMGTFGHNDEGVCWGCAATCALQQIASRNLDPKQDTDSPTARAKQLGLDISGLSSFECAIDALRSESTTPLLDLYEERKGLDYSGFDFSGELEPLDSTGWDEHIRGYEILAAALEEHERNQRRP